MIGTQQTCDFRSEVDFLNSVKFPHLFYAGSRLEQVAVVFKCFGYYLTQRFVGVEFPPCHIGDSQGVVRRLGSVCGRHCQLRL